MIKTIIVICVYHRKYILTEIFEPWKISSIILFTSHHLRQSNPQPKAGEQNDFKSLISSWRFNCIRLERSEHRVGFSKWRSFVTRTAIWVAPRSNHRQDPTFGCCSLQKKGTWFKKKIRYMWRVALKGVNINNFQNYQHSHKECKKYLLQLPPPTEGSHKLVGNPTGHAEMQKA